VYLPAQLYKVDVEKALADLRTDHLLKMLSSLGTRGAALSRDLVHQSPHLLAPLIACLEPCKFEATTFLFHAGKLAGEVFFVVKGQCSILYEDTASVPIERENPLVSRQIPAVRGRNKSKDLICVSNVQAPCILGLKHDVKTCTGSISKRKTFVEINAHFFPTTTDQKLLGHAAAVYSASAQATSSVEAYSISKTASEVRFPELKTFFQRLNQCLEPHSSTNTTDSASNESTFQSKVEGADVHAVKQQVGESIQVSASGQTEQGCVKRSGRARSRLNPKPTTKMGTQIAAADLGRFLFRKCARFGESEKTYRNCRPCQNCLRLTYPKEEAFCDKCGFPCDGSGQPKLYGDMTREADLTLEHLLELRDYNRQRQEPEVIPSPKSGLHDETSTSSYATVLSQVAYPARTEFDNEQLDRLQIQHSVDEALYGEVNHASMFTGAGTTRTSLIMDHMQPQDNTPALSKDREPETSPILHLFDLLRPRTSGSSQIGQGLGPPHDEHDSQVLWDGTRRQRDKMARPATCGPGRNFAFKGLDHVQAVVRETRKGSAAASQGKGAMSKVLPARSRSAMGFRMPASNNPARLDFLSDDRPRTSSVVQTPVMVSRPTSSHGWFSSQDIGLDGVLGSPLMSRRSSQALSSPLNRMQTPQPDPLLAQGHDAKGEGDQVNLSALQSKHVKPLRELRKNSLLYLDETGEEEEETSNGFGPRGPSAFLVSQATRSQVNMRRSTPKYIRLARLHSGSQGAIY
jgi:hypothetical protein